MAELERPSSASPHSIADRVFHAVRRFRPFTLTVRSWPISDRVSQIKPRLPHLKRGTACCCRIEALRTPCQELRTTCEALTILLSNARVESL
jgi:hypothetical protein